MEHNEAYLIVFHISNEFFTIFLGEPSCKFQRVLSYIIKIHVLNMPLQLISACNQLNKYI